jgi:hypothetical protein
MAALPLERSRSPQSGAERLMRALVRRGLAEEALHRAAALALHLDNEAAARRGLGEVGEVAAPMRRCGHRDHAGDPWLPCTPEHFYHRPNGSVATWCRDCVRRDNQVRTMRRAERREAARAAA